MGKTKIQPPIQDSDSEESSPAPIQTKKSTKVVKPVKKVADDSDEEISVPVKKNEKKGPIQKAQPQKQNKKAQQSSEESSEENVPAKNAKVVPKTQISKKKQVQQSSEESDAEIIAPKKTAVTSTKKDVKKTKAVSKQESSEESSEEVEKVIKKPTNKKPATKVAQVESDSEEESEQPAKKQASRKPSKDIKAQPKKAVQSADQDDSESEQKPKPRKASKEVKKPIKKVVSSDQSEEEEQPTKKKTVTKGKTIQKDDSSEEEQKPLPKRKGSAESLTKKIANKKAEEPVEEDEQGEFEIAVKGLSYNAYDGDIRSFFEQCGNITNVKLLTKPDGSPKGFAFVRFSSRNSLNKALELNGTQMMGRSISIQQAKGKSNGAQGSQGGFGNQRSNNDRPQGVIESATLYIGGLSYSSTNESIYNFFSQVGQVQSARMVTDKETQQSRGFGYVEFFDVETAKKAYEQLNGAELDGRRIRLDGATQRERPQGGNRGGNRGGFGGGNRGGFGGRNTQF